MIGLGKVKVAAAIATSGMVDPLRPDRTLRSLMILQRWGASFLTAAQVNAVLQPDEIALVDDSGMLSFAELDGGSNALARAILNMDIGSDGRVGIVAANNRHFIETCFAAAKAGKDLVPIGTTLAAPQLRSVIEGQRVKLLFFDSSMAHVVKEATSGIDIERVSCGGSDDQGRSSIRNLDEAIEGVAQDRLSPPGRPSRIIALTSGTTGAPKGARRESPDSIETLLNFLDIVPRQHRTTCLITVPLYHMHGFAQFVISTALGCRIVLTERPEAERVLRLIDRYRATELIAVPLILKRVLDLPQRTKQKYDTSSLELVLSSGSALNHELAKSFMVEFGPILYNLYGATELGWATIASPEDLMERPGTVGRPPEGVNVEILDRNDRPVGKNRPGRIFVDGELLYQGYTDPTMDRPKVGQMMSVGDMGHFDDDGYLYVDSREDDMIISGAENIYPGEIEHILLDHPEIEEAAVIGMTDSEWGEAVKAFVVTAPGSSLSEDDVRIYVKNNLASYKAPKKVEFRQSLPKNQIGKVLKAELVDG